MFEKSVSPIPPAYHELSHFLFMLEMSYIKPSSVNVEELRCKVNELIAVIHANNVLEFINLKIQVNNE